ncbi:MAG: glycogen synthase GlgA [Candidatus Omnitrophica bacterium CG11_big_fil_rev_8_21_14_0_20_45_26]|uniref:Glycogen synthase n=1 Tax=Candidatus Abzuiibacterium crystallinum TaxID=1974748 RepID=A0A2H0LNJ4_9BACT|nr:MAG: glycogen synthase GlgA [Candidatus Omnitrophica bacterium CG11_big_fil_rev_8_21_14_0_20_45_26]
MLMEIVFITAEMEPFAKTGGLADVCGSLPQEIVALGHRVSVFLPKYRSVSEHKYSLELLLDPIDIPVGTEVETGRLYGGRWGDVNVFFIDQPYLYDRDALYGTPMGDYPDNDIRFIFFQRAVIESLKKLKLKPDIIHCHDWQGGLIPVYLKTIYRKDPFYKDTKTIFTIHNLAYQGNFPPDSISTTGLSWDEFRYDRLEFYGKISFLKGGLVYSDLLTTVSKRYAEEIQTSDFGCGMESVLSDRKDELVGILNGIDLKEWNPAHDPDIPKNYTAKTIERKTECKLALQKENKLKVDPDVPLFGFIGRLSSQKGIDLLEPIIENIKKAGWQLILLGTGDDQYQQRFREAARKFPQHFSAHITFDGAMAKRIYAGVDLFLMISQYEPCGLGQMYALRYGTVPLVREVGGLVDTVTPYKARSHKGTGFRFLDYTPQTLFKTMKKAVQVFQDKEAWRKLILRGMECDFSWQASARQYVDVYERAEKKTISDSSGL